MKFICACSNLFLSFILLYYTIATGQEVNLKSRKIPSIALRGSSLEIIAYYDHILQNIREKLSQYFEVPSDTIWLSSSPPITTYAVIIYFGIDSEKLKIGDSILTPESDYKDFTERLSTLVRSKFDIEIPEASSTRKHTFQVSNPVEYTYPPSFSYHNGSVPLDIECHVPNLPDPAMVETIKNTNFPYMQLRLQESSNALDTSYVAMDKLIQNLKKVSSSIFSISKDDVLLVGVDEDTKFSYVVQFTLYPQTDMQTALAKWNQAFLTKDNRLTEHFKTIDFTYPPLTVKFKTSETPFTSFEQDPKSSLDKTSAPVGIVVGSVFGALAGVLVLGGVGYYAKKKLQQKSKSQKDKSDINNLDSNSIGRGDESP